MIHPLLHVKVLEALETAPYFFGDLFLIFSSAYGSSIRSIQRRLDEAHGVRPRKLEELKHRRFSDLVYRLKRDGFIEGRVNEGSKTLVITKRGKGLLKELRARESKFMPTKMYPREKDCDLKIIVFDVPEKHRRKRDWLRSVLTNMGFSMVQRSVWVGKAGIPKDFLEDVNKLNMVNYIEVLSVDKRGTLDRVGLANIDS